MAKQTQTREQAIRNFWSRVRKTDNCWLWTGSTTKQGYGLFKWDGKLIYCHRFSAELVGLEIEDKIILHSCDNPPCVNPEHLLSGTHGHNVEDKVSKGRQNRGENVPQAKLTEDDIRAIRVLLSRGVMQKEIARQYGITQPLVSKINKRVIWDWVK